MKFSLIPVSFKYLPVCSFLNFIQTNFVRYVSIWKTESKAFLCHAAIAFQPNAKELLFMLIIKFHGISGLTSSLLCHHVPPRIFIRLNCFQKQVPKARANCRLKPIRYKSQIFSGPATDNKEVESEILKFVTIYVNKFHHSREKKGTKVGRNPGNYMVSHFSPKLRGPPPWFDYPRVGID